MMMRAVTCCGVLWHTVTDCSRPLQTVTDRYRPLQTATARATARLGDENEGAARLRRGRRGQNAVGLRGDDRRIEETQEEVATEQRAHLKPTVATAGSAGSPRALMSG